MDTARFLGDFSTPNGEKLFLNVTVVATHDKLGLRGAMFCGDCYKAFMETIGQGAHALRLTYGKTPAQGS